MWKLIDKALAVLPVSRWAVGISGAIAAFSLVVARFEGISGAFIAGLLILCLMILMVVFAAIAQIPKSAIRPIAIVCAWGFMLLFMTSSIATATSLFFDQPKPFIQLRDEILSLLGSSEAAEDVARTAAEENQRLAAEESAKDEIATVQQELGRAEVRLDVQPSQPPGPPQKVRVSFGDGLYKTISYWSGGKRSRLTWCQAELVPVEGMTLVGGKDTTSYDSRRFLTRPSPNPRGCAPSGHCDSHNEFCETFYRESGCYISTAWLEWYRAGRQRDGLPERVEDICQA